MLLVQKYLSCKIKYKIIEDVNFSLGNGKVIVLKGKNGSGKTSLIKILLCLLKPTSGSVYWKGKDLKKIYMIFIKKLHIFLII